MHRSTSFHYLSGHCLPCCWKFSAAVEWSILQTPGQTCFCKERIARSLRSVRLGTARCRDGECRVCVILNAAISLIKNHFISQANRLARGSGAAHSGGHVVVDFCSSSNRHVVTHHRIICGTDMTSSHIRIGFIRAILPWMVRIRRWYDEREGTWNWGY
jgi:hypothetical protein